MGRLAGKVAFITGAGGGIGRAAVARFVAEGARVAVADINVESAAATVEASWQYAPRSDGAAIAIHCDVGERDSVEKAIIDTIATFGKLDILYNNAGGSTFRDGSVTDVAEEEFWHVMKVEVWGLFLCARYAIPEIIKAGGGAVINTTSILAQKGVPGRDCYTAAKGAIAAITRSMAVEYAPSRVRVNAIAPSVTLTPRVKAMLAQSTDFDRLAGSHLLGLAEPADIAEMAVYLASDEARITTGQILAVDSGAGIS